MATATLSTSFTPKINTSEPQQLPLMWWVENISVDNASYQPVGDQLLQPSHKASPTCNLQPCNDDIVSIAVSVKPRTLTAPDSHCSPSVSQRGQCRWGTARAECANRQTCECSPSGNACVCQEPFDSSSLLDRGASLKHNTITPMRHSGFRRLKAPLEIRNRQDFHR